MTGEEQPASSQCLRDTRESSCICRSAQWLLSCLHIRSYTSTTNPGRPPGAELPAARPVCPPYHHLLVFLSPPTPRLGRRRTLPPSARLVGPVPAVLCTRPVTAPIPPEEAAAPHYRSRYLPPPCVARDCTICL